MDRRGALWIAGLLACTARLTASLDESFALERPVHAAVVVLFIAGVALLLSESIPALQSSRAKDQHYAPIPLSDLNEAPSSRPNSSASAEVHAPEVRPRLSLRLQCVLAAFLLSARVEILRQVTAGVECSTTTAETLVPVFVAVADWWYIQRYRRPHREDHDDMDSDIYADLCGAAANSPWRSLAAVSLLSWTSAIAISKTLPPRSTYVCSEFSRDYTMIPRLQVAGVVLDGLLAMLLFQLLDLSTRRSSQTSSKGVSCLGLSCIISAAFWLAIGAMMYFWGSPGIRALISPTPMYFTSSVMKLALILSFAAMCALRSVHYIGMLNTSVLILFTSAYISIFIPTWNHSHPFPPLPGGIFLSFVGMTISLIFYSIPSSSAEEGSRSSSRSIAFARSWGFFPILGFLLFLQAILVNNGDDEVRYHPIDMLMYDAHDRHEHWVKWASSSLTVEHAAANYTARYKRQPPPYFDEWFSFAARHSSVVIDDFDSIHDDLLPFWSLSPAEIRRRTWEAIADPSKGVGGVLIREGKTTIAANVPEDQRPMLDGIVQMIGKFSQWLPDMDLAFSLTGCHVAVPFEEMRTIKANAETAVGKENPPVALVNDFSGSRASHWQPLPEEPFKSPHFTTVSSHSIWDEFGSLTCPPNSLARTERVWNNRNFCTECALPHSLGDFLANWTLSADICSQPDLADLHGFYSSPDSFHGTHYLMPIFSQSKAHGFNDILYPSPWDYLQKLKYAPSKEYPDRRFEDKTSALFWRDTTSEGFAAEGTDSWKGMTQQRMVRLVSNTSTPQALLLPYPVAHYKRKLRYVWVDPATLHNGTHAAGDAHFTSITHCAGTACAEQERLFALAPPEEEFQRHWSHRFLFDTDSSPAGRSDRFFAFLHSKSLPFKLASPFREWWHGRVTPWLHFVPVDPRLHGLWATLAFFANFEEVVDGQPVRWEGKEGEAKRLAMAGRAWAREVLRREDMEVYMFRLLLEWGRLTDDAREGIGFVPVEGEGEGEGEGGENELEDFEG